MLRADLSDLLSTCWIHRLMVATSLINPACEDRVRLKVSVTVLISLLILTKYKFLCILISVNIGQDITKKYRNGERNDLMVQARHKDIEE